MVDKTIERQRFPTAQYRVGFAVSLVMMLMLGVNIMLILIPAWAEKSYYVNMPFRSPSWMFFEVILPGLSLGFFAAQLTLTILCAGLGDGSSPKRVLYTTFVLAIFTNVLVLFNIWYFRTSWGDAVGIFLGPMLLFFLLQIPFWGVRTYFGWIIKSPWSAPTERRRMSFTLAHLLGWSAFLAIPLCILQAYGIPNISELFAITSIALTWCALVALLVYLALGTAIRPSGLLVAATLASLLAVAVQTGVIMLAEPSPTRLWEPATMLLAAHCSGTTVILVCLKITRWLGFRLVAPVSIT